MISIRKFVGYAGGAAGLAAALAIAMSTQTGVASTQPAQHRIEPAAASTTQVTLSAACTTAIANLKTAYVADIAEDKAEYATIKLNGTDPDNDSAEGASFMALWNAVRTACVPGATSGLTTTAPTFTHTYTPSAACTAAVQALKGAWAQHPTTQAQWQQLRTLAQAARTACGLSWSSSSGWSFNR